MTITSPYQTFAPALMTRDVAAYYLSASVREVDYLRADGKLRAVGAGKRVKFRKTDLDAYLATLPLRTGPAPA
jgi:excisionase family DNA binding protein